MNTKTTAAEDARIISALLPRAKAYALFVLNEHGSLDVSINGTMKALAEVIAPALREEAAGLEREWQEEFG